MKVLLLTREYPPEVYGGAGVHVEYLARELSGLAEVEVRTFGRQQIDAGALVVRGHADALRAGGASPPPPALHAVELSLALAEGPVDADVVHCHTWYSHLGGIAVRLLHGIPLVVTAHLLEPLRPWKREQLGRGADLTAWVEREALTMADAVVAVSTEMRRDVLRHFPVDPNRVHVIPNGVDTDTYRPVAGHSRLERLGIDPDRPYVLFIGRISRQKGLLHLLAAAAHLDPRVPIVLCAATPDTPDVEREVATAVHRLQASRGGIQWIPRMVDRETAVELYSHAAVFCCPSIYEPFGIINLEAMACEVPVVASAVGGIPGIVVHGETGYLVPVDPVGGDVYEPRDPAGFARALADALTTVLADPALRRKMGALGRERAATHFSWRAVAERTLALYRAVAGRGGH
jgi:starch synthase